MCHHRSSVRVVISVIAACSICLPTAVAKKPTKPGGGGPTPVQSNPAVAFRTVSANGRQDIVVAAADLESEIVLTDSIQYRVGKGRNSFWAYYFGSPTWSPDGSMVAFWAHFRPNDLLHGNDQLWVISADGAQSGMILEYPNNSPYLPQNGVSGALNWSPAGMELVYEAYSGSGILVAVDVVTGDINELLDGGTSYENPVSQPSLSPDLDAAAGYQGMVAIRGAGDIFTAPISSDANGFLLPIDPSTIQNVTRSSAIEAHPSWSPDGSAIACYQDDGVTEWLAVIDFPSGVLVPIYPDYATVGSGHDRATWTSDGLDLIYRTGDSGIDIFDLSIIPADGSGIPSNYTGTGSRREAGPAWNPNWDPTGPGGFRQ